MVPGMIQMWEDGTLNFRLTWLSLMKVIDRKGRAAGKDPIIIPVVSNDPAAPSALPTPDSYEFFTAWEKKSTWKNEVTLRR